MMRVITAAAVAATLLTTTSLLAAETNAPLPPAGAAGVKQAQDTDWTPLLIIGGGIGIIAAVALSQDSPNSIGQTAPGLVTPSVST
jgi:hypothetical protein